MNNSDRIVSAFNDRFGAGPQVVAFGPGRIEVLGNHTDYNEGYVLAAAIPEGIYVAMGASTDSSCCFSAVDFDDEITFDLPELATVEGPGWFKYCQGVLTEWMKIEPFEQGCNVVLGGDLPVGSGLSSSAALEVALAEALIFWRNADQDPMELAKMCQRAESKAVGVHCGLMDQLSCVYGEENHVLFMDFREVAVTPVPFPDDAVFLVCDPGTPHVLLDSEYNRRRRECEEALVQLQTIMKRQLRSLRDVSVYDLADNRQYMDDILARRAMHIVSENQRVLQAVKAMGRGDLSMLGGLMYASHESSINNFENSSTDQDFIVQKAHRHDLVYGARLSGGGFGGNVLLLIEEGKVELVEQNLKQTFFEIYDRELRCRMVYPAHGACIMHRP